MRNAFHHAAVAHENIGAMIDDGAVFFGQQFLREGHAHCIANTLAKRARRGLDARRDANLRMPWRFAVKLAEILDLRHW